MKNSDLKKWLDMFPDDLDIRISLQVDDKKHQSTPMSLGKTEEMVTDFSNHSYAEDGYNHEYGLKKIEYLELKLNKCYVNENPFKEIKKL